MKFERAQAIIAALRAQYALWHGSAQHLTIVLAISIALAACTSSDDTTKPATALADVPRFTASTIIRLVAEDVCPRRATVAQEALRKGAATPTYQGRGIWRVAGTGTWQGKTVVMSWEVDEVSGRVAPQGDGALVLHAIAEAGGGC